MKKVAIVVLAGTTPVLAQSNFQQDVFSARMYQLQQRQAERVHQYEEQLKVENVCEQPGVQKVLMSNYNGKFLPGMAGRKDGVGVQKRGRLVKVFGPTTQMALVSAGVLSCAGTFKFEDGSTNRQTFSFPYVFGAR